MTTTTSRRALLGGAFLGLVSAPFASLRPAFAAPRSLYSRVRFVPLLKRRFSLQFGRQHWTVRLTRISDLSHAAKGDNRSFALTFRSETAGPPQGTYVLRRRGFTPTTLFVVPDASHRTYQAVIFRAPRQRRPQ
jgi:hypothetical protein